MWIEKQWEIIKKLETKVIQNSLNFSDKFNDLAGHFMTFPYWTEKDGVFLWVSMTVANLLEKP